MTPQQQTFVDYYVGKARFNATQAAEMAGYKSPRQQGSNLKRTPEIAEAIKARLSEKALAAEEVLALLTDQATGSLDDFLFIDGVYARPDLEKAKQAGKLHLLKKYKYGKDGIEIELLDPQAALIQLGRHHKLFTDRTEHSGKLKLDILGDLPEETIDQRIQELEERKAQAAVSPVS